MWAVMVHLCMDIIALLLYYIKLDIYELSTEQTDLFFSVYSVVVWIVHLSTKMSSSQLCAIQFWKRTEIVIKMNQNWMTLYILRINDVRLWQPRGPSSESDILSSQGLNTHWTHYCVAALNTKHDLRTSTNVLARIIIRNNMLCHTMLLTTQANHRLVFAQNLLGFEDYKILRTFQCVNNEVCWSRCHKCQLW